MSTLTKDLVESIVRDSVQFGFGLISTRVAHPITTRHSTEGYAKLLKEEHEIIAELPQETEINEVDVMRDLISSSISAIESGDNEYAKLKIQKAVADTSCKRCARKLLELDWDNEDSLLLRLRTIHELVPYYHKILEEEASLDEPQSQPRVETETTTEECGECEAIKIMETCHWNKECIDSVMDWINAKKAAGESITKKDLTATALTFVNP